MSQGAPTRPNKSPACDVTYVSFAAGATGNVATEDVVYMLEGLGIKSGIDMDQLVDAGQFISNAIGRPGSSRAANAIMAQRRQREAAAAAVLEKEG